MPSTSTFIDAPPEVVWDMVADVTRIGEWSPEAVGAEWIDGASRAEVGARFKGHNKRKGKWSSTCVVTAAERGKTFAFVVGKDETRWQYDFEAQGTGCSVTESFEILRVPGRVGRWLTKVGAGMPWAEREDDLTRGMEETLRRLKEGAEGA